MFNFHGIITRCLCRKVPWFYAEVLALMGHGTSSKLFQGGRDVGGWMGNCTVIQKKEVHRLLSVFLFDYSICVCRWLISCYIGGVEKNRTSRKTPSLLSNGGPFSLFTEDCWKSLAWKDAVWLWEDRVWLGNGNRPTVHSKMRKIAESS